MLRNNTKDISYTKSIQTLEQLMSVSVKSFYSNSDCWRHQMLHSSQACSRHWCPILTQDRIFPGREIRVPYACTRTLITPHKHFQVLSFLGPNRKKCTKVHQIQNKMTLDCPNYTTPINRRGSLQVTYLKAFLTSSRFPDQSKCLGMDHFFITSYFQLLTFLVQV